MEIAKLKVTGVRCTPQKLGIITRGMVGAEISLEYADPLWDGLTKTVVFRGAVAKDVINAGETVTVPPEVLAVSSRVLSVGVYGVDADGTLVIPTLWADLGKVMPSADPSGDTSTNPSLPVWAQLSALIGNLDDLTTKAKENLVAAVNEVAAKGGGGGTAADVRMDVSGGYIRYSADGGENWTNLVAMSGLVGKPGDPGDDGETPFIGENGRWWVGATDTGVQAQGEPGKNGVTPHIGENGNWYIGDTDTGVQAQGTPGNDYTLTEADKKEIAGMVEVTGGGISVSGATVGQTVKISAVDDDGVPTAWEPVDLPSGGGGDSDGTGVLELIVDHTVTAEEGQATSITFTKEAYPLIDGQKLLYLKVEKPTAAIGWWSLKAGKIEVIKGTGSSTDMYQHGIAVVAHGVWLYNESQSTNSTGEGTCIPAMKSKFPATQPVKNNAYAYYDSLTLSSYTKVWPEGTIIKIYGGRFV